MITHKRKILGFLIIICLLQLFNSLLSVTIAGNLENFAHTLSLVPSLFQTYITYPDSAIPYIKQSTCFPMKVTLDAEKDQSLLFFVLNYHTLTLTDSLGNIVREVDSGMVFRNAKDTVITLRVKVVRKNSNLDLVLMENVDKIPPAFNIETTGIKIDLNEQVEPQVGEKIFYSGFPLLLGQDATLKQNYPLVLEGLVAQVIPNKPDFIVQAPVFSGASGSPIMSQNDGRFLGVIWGKVPGQESLLYAVKANTIRAWIKSILSEAFKKKQ
jgi:hypothetical protein